MFALIHLECGKSNVILDSQIALRWADSMRCEDLLFKGGAALSKVNISIKEFLSDIRNGMNEPMIRQKYGLESGQFQRLLRKLMVAGHLSEMELFHWLKLSETDAFSAFGMETDPPAEVSELENGSSGLAETLLATRSVGQPVNEVEEPPSAINRIPLQIPIYESGRADWKGFLRDLSERELRVACATENFCSVGEVKSLCIATDRLYSSESIRLEARCQWIQKKGRKRAYYVAGFEITAISGEEIEKVRSLIRKLLSEFQIPATEAAVQRDRKPTADAAAQPGPAHIPKFERTYELFLRGEEYSGLSHNK